MGKRRRRKLCKVAWWGGGGPGSGQVGPAGPWEALGRAAEPGLWPLCAGSVPGVAPALPGLPREEVPVFTGNAGRAALEVGRGAATTLSPKRRKRSALRSALVPARGDASEDPGQLAPPPRRPSELRNLLCPESSQHWTPRPLPADRGPCCGPDRGNAQRSRPVRRRGGQAACRGGRHPGHSGG